jgi:DNA polymerase-3 subunit beta
MSNIHIPTNVLRDVKRLFGKLRIMRSRLPVLNCIRLEANQNGISLAVTDLDLWVELRISEQPSNTALFLIPSDAMERACRADRNSMVKLSPTGTRKAPTVEMTLVQGGIEVSSVHPTIDEKEFPLRPIVVGPSCEVPPATLESLSQIAGCASKDITRQVLAGVLFTPEGEGRMVASDGRRLACAPAIVPPVPFVLPCLAASILGHPSFIADITSIRWDFTGEPETHRIQFKCGPLSLISRTIEGNYPNFEQVIPREAKEIAVIPHDRRPGVIAWLRSFTGTNSVRLDWSKRGQLTLTHQNTDGASSVLNVPVEIHGSPPIIAFHPEHLADALKIGSTLCMSDEISACICRHPSGRFCVMLPTRLSVVPVARIEQGQAAA